MTPAPSVHFADLPDLTRGFIVDPALSPQGADGLVRALARFDTAAYAADLFEICGIARPARLHRAVDKRCAEFLAGRLMAQGVMGALGVPCTAIPIGEDRAPVWPAGLRASISHARGRVCCLGGPETSGTPGIDVEEIAEGRALTAIRKVSLTEPERAVVAAQADGALWSTAVFSGKEALFKALYPQVGRIFGFHAAALTEIGEDGALHLQLTEDLTEGLPEGRRFQITCERHGNHVLTWLLHRGD